MGITTNMLMLCLETLSSQKSTIHTSVPVQRNFGCNMCFIVVCICTFSLAKSQNIRGYVPCETSKLFSPFLSDVCWDDDFPA